MQENLSFVTQNSVHSLDQEKHFWNRLYSSSSTTQSSQIVELILAVQVLLKERQEWSFLEREVCTREFQVDFALLLRYLQYKLNGNAKNNQQRIRFERENACYKLYLSPTTIRDSFLHYYTHHRNIFFFSGRSVEKCNLIFRNGIRW